MTLGDRIKKLRVSRKMTQEELARTIDSTKQNIYKYENNIVANIPSDKIERLAIALDTTPSYLMGWDEDHLTTISLDKNNIEVLKDKYGISSEYSYDMDKSEYNDQRSKLIQSNYELMNSNGKDSMFKITYLLKQLNANGQCEAVKRVEELTLINKYTFKENSHLFANAAHEIEDASEKDKEHDDAIMDDEEF